MRLATYTFAGRTQAGAVVDGAIIPLNDRSGTPLSVRGVLKGGADGRAFVKRACEGAGQRLSLEQVKLEAPIPDPRKFMGIGGNYRGHIEEMRRKQPEFRFPANQVWFNKQTSCIIGPYDPMYKPAVSNEFDYEAEVAFVIGQRCRNVKAIDAGSVIAGYMVCNDGSVRDWQRRSPTGTLGKSFDTHGPMGPWLTLGLGIEEAEDLEIRSWVNGELRQQGRTSDFIYRIGEMVAELSSVFTLEPGDIFATGTPPGTGVGMTPTGFLNVGDVLRIEVDRLGMIENAVVAEPDPIPVAREWA
jgi:2-keto-4-pentenoate hydratase/2-oxohepta-3-ene-1,7-dioic acid hydratase in catechol pathway